MRGVVRTIGSWGQEHGSILVLGAAAAAAAAIALHLDSGDAVTRAIPGELVGVYSVGDGVAVEKYMLPDGSTCFAVRQAVSYQVGSRQVSLATPGH